MSEDEARAFLEAIRWPQGPVCPHCKSGSAYRLAAKPDSKRPVRAGVLKCKTCRKQFTVTVGTIFERSHVSLVHWVMAFHLICSSKKGMSAHQLHRTLGVTYKTAWFIFHRIRHAMGEEPLSSMLRGTVEVDETYIGGKHRPGSKTGRGTAKTPVIALVERNGRVHARMMKRVTGRNIEDYMRARVDRNARIMTDEYSAYRRLGSYFRGRHFTVNHSQKEYARGDVTTNTVESFFSLLKRGVIGSFHHVSDKHLDRYCDEFSFRWGTRKLTDEERTLAALRVAPGKRLMYRQPVTMAE